MPYSNGDANFSAHQAQPLNSFSSSRAPQGGGALGWPQQPELQLASQKFDRMSADWSGVGVKIGIIDSGCDVSHPILRHIERGVDLTRNHDPQSWQTDELGHGTHCAGIIAGLDILQIGVYCGQFSELVTQKIAAAQMRGIASVMGSGNSDGPVQFPANIPGTLWDGSTLAASHVTGMAALLLSHHQALQHSDYAGRPAYRIAVLKSLIQAAALPLAHLDPSQVGAGLLNLERVPTLLAARHLIGIPELRRAWAMPAWFPFSVCPA